MRTPTPRSAARSQPGRDEWALSWLQRWDKGKAKWIRVDEGALPVDAPLLPPRSSHTHPRLSFMTYNTFSSSPTHTRAQSLALASLISDSGCAFIALEEVSAPFYRFLLAQPSFRNSGYAVSTPEKYWHISGRGSPNRGKEGAREACVVLVKEGLLGRGSEVRVGRLGRGRDEGGKAAVGVRVFSGGREVVSRRRLTAASPACLLGGEGIRSFGHDSLTYIHTQLRLATSHFSSLPFNASLRTRQFRTCLSFLSQRSASSTSSDATSSSSMREVAAKPVCVLLGDFNASNGAEFDSLTSDSSLALVDAFDLFSARSHSSSRSKESKKRTRSQREDGAGAGDSDSFRAPPTFGHLYPWIRPPSTLKTRTPKPRKVRRIDRVYISPSSEVNVRGYEHRGGEPLEGETDGCGRDGGMFASDHEAVVVEVEFVVKW